jgi:hypothetical protein
MPPYPLSLRSILMLSNHLRPGPLVVSFLLDLTLLEVYEYCIQFCIMLIAVVSLENYYSEIYSLACKLVK